MNQFIISLPVLGYKPDQLCEYSVDQIKNEPMLFSCDESTAYELGGPITRRFIERLVGFFEPPHHPKWIIDSRVHMLMAGWYPCIPGWHHDDVPRSGVNGQPDYIHPAYRSKHVSAIVDAGTGSLTEFVTDPVCLELPPEDQTVYKVWNEKLNRLKPRSIQPPSGAMVLFDDRTFHRGVPATGTGWRFFIRASTNTDRPFLNERRQQVQVYMSELEAGW